MKFLRCTHCGNFVGKVIDNGIPLVCCGDPMEQVVPNTVEASFEKHLPVISFDDCCVEVNVGEADHPMMEEHHIDFIYVETKNGGQRKTLAVDGAPHARFCVVDDEVVAVYAYCNLHGLWKTEV